ncbi:type II toxin-antitoxin system Phd/YefM family antitoxin [Gemmatimonadota bacterium]
MKVYTYSEARRRFASILDEARAKGSVLIRRRDGQEFLLRPVEDSGSPLDVEGLDLGWSREEIVAAVREGRER